MRKIAIILLFLMFALNSQAQDGSLFDFQMQRIDTTNYLMQLQLSENSSVQYIQVHFLENGNALAIDEASLNKKSDGKYYLFFDGTEREVFLDNIELTLPHDFGMLTEPAVLVKLIDKDFNTIDSYQQIID